LRQAVNGLASKVTEEAGINTMERRIALRLAFKLCTDRKNGNEQKTDTQRIEINYKGRTYKKRGSIAEQEKSKM
jgi:hypothetical protein